MLFWKTHLFLDIFGVIVIIDYADNVIEKVVAYPIMINNVKLKIMVLVLWREVYI